MLEVDGTTKHLLPKQAAEVRSLPADLPKELVPVEPATRSPLVEIHRRLVFLRARVNGELIRGDLEIDRVAIAEAARRSEVDLSESDPQTPPTSPAPP